MKLLLYTSQQIKHNKLDVLTNIIYNNFIYLSQYKQVQHTQEYIKNIFKSDDVILIIAYENNKIIGYLLADSQTLQDTRRVVFISYLYVAPQFRHKNIASDILKFLEEYIKSINKIKINNYNGLMLVADTYKESLIKFYEKRGFMSDLYLRNFERFDTFYKHI